MGPQKNAQRHNLPVMETKRDTSWDGRMRTLYRKACGFCSADFWIPKSQVERSTCCSIKCRGQLKNKLQSIKLTCSTCSIEFEARASRVKKSKSGLHFCSRKCKDLGQRFEAGIKEIWPSHYDRGVRNYRARALRQLGESCKRCGYSADVRMLDVDHIDSNRSNNALENLQVLCVWCHALKTRGVEEAL